MEEGLGLGGGSYPLPSPPLPPSSKPKLIGGILLKMANRDLEIKNYKVKGETVRVNLEFTPLGKTKPMFFKAFHEAKGDKTTKSPTMPRLAPWDAGNWHPDT